MEPVQQQAARIREYFQGAAGRRRYDELVLFAKRTSMRQQFTSGGALLEPPEHYVNESISRCLPDANGRIARQFDPSSDLNLMLRGTIRSVISHEMRPSNARVHARGNLSGVEIDGEAVEKTVESFENSLWSDINSSESIRTNTIAEFDERPIVEAFKRFVEHDEIVFQMVNLLLEEDIDEPATLVAEKIRISVKMVKNARKRYFRLCREFCATCRN